MAKYKAGAVTAMQVGALLSPVAQAALIPPMLWSRRKPDMRGAVAVTTAVVECDGEQLSMHFVPSRPWALHFIYRVNGVPVRRVDTNDKHSDWPISTHEHCYQPADGSETCALLTTFPAPALLQTVVTAADLRVSFEAFAARCSVALTDSYWIDPPEWR